MVESRPGEGTSFSVYLPVAAEGLLTEKKTKQALQRFGRETILVVDDRSIVELMTDFLTPAGVPSAHIVKRQGGPAEDRRG